MTNFNFENFKQLLEQKDVSIPEFEANEFFEEISEKLEEETNIFDLLDENLILERLTEMLEIMSLDTLLELSLAKICTLLKCSEANFRNLCYKFSQNLVSCNEFYSVNSNDIDYLTSRDITDEEIFLTEDEINENKKFEKNHVVQSFDMVDDYDQNVDAILVEI